MQDEDRRITDPFRLYEPLFETEEVDLGLRGVIVVRGLSRAEVFDMQTVKDPGEAEVRTLAAAVVTPNIDEAGARRWQAASAAGEIRQVIDVVSRLTGMEEDADKAAYKSPDESAGTGDGSLPDGAAGVRNGGQDAPGDAQR